MADITIKTKKAYKKVVISCKPYPNEILKATFDTLLRERKMRQCDLIKPLGLDKSTISRIVRGIYEPSLDMKLKISSLFNVDSRVIWGDKQGGNPPNDN